jgi:ribonuclease VapC
VSRRKLLDSFALLSYLNKERGFEKVREALAEAQVSDGSVLMNEVNVGETYYILHRQRGVQEAEYFLDTVLVGLPILLVQNDFQNLSFADCFAVATARRESAIILTGDPEFKKIEHLAKIEWLSE